MLRSRWLTIAGVLAAPAAFAEPTEEARVVTIGADPQVEQALELALASWRVKVVESQEPAPGRDLDDAIRTAHRIARAAGARGVVWTTPGAAPDAAWSLWVYDDRAHQIAIRPLPAPPPYDDATSAAIALTVKTLLLGAFEGEPVAPTPPVEPAPPKVAPKPRAPLHTFRFETVAGARVPTNASDVVAARFGAEITYFPSFARQKLGLAIGVDAGPSVLVDRAPYFEGTFTDTVASVSLRWRIPLRRWLALELGAGPGIHFSAIEGSAPMSGLSGRVTRVDASIEATLAVEFAWKLLRVSPFVGGSFLVHYQNYRVEDVQVLDVPPAQAFFGLRVGAELP